MRLQVTWPWVFIAAAAACSSSPRSTPDAGSFVVGSRAGGGASTGSSPSVNTSTGEGQGCSTSGQKRSCCGAKGTQVCSGTAEFKAWGPCLDAKGAAASCDLPQQTGCGIGEFSRCDAGVDSGVPHHCGEGEFGPDCTKQPLCTDKTINNEPEILAAYSPAAGETVSATGQIRVWVNDEWAAFIAPGEQVDNTTGAIVMAGDRSSKSHDGYLYEPALYIGPETADKGGTPHFPSLIKGWYNNAPPATKPKKMAGVVLGAQSVAVDPAPAGTKLREQYTTEFVWEVRELGLAPGRYLAQFVIGDGDYDRAVGCVTIEISK